ncbi:MAG: hypothetical protein WDN72_00525 [Alphaproteobacteria bacterium]
MLDAAFALMRTPLFGPRAAAWCDFLDQRNAGAMFLSTDIDNAARMPAGAAVAGKCASIFAMPDEEPTAAYTMFGLTDADIATLAYLRDGQALLKRGAESLPLKLHLESLGPKLRATLSGDAPPAFAPQSLAS